MLVAIEIDAVPFGSASQRVFDAPSEQNGAFGAYGMRPLAGCAGIG